MDQNKLAKKIERMQQTCLFIFVPTAAIAIFSDNILFETIAFIAGITFAVVSYIDSQL